MNWRTTCVSIGLLLMGGLYAEEAETEGANQYELTNSFMVSGFQVSSGRIFPGVSIKMTSSVAETIVGTSSKILEGFVVNSGGILPNSDLLFINDFQ